MEQAEVLKLKSEPGESVTSVRIRAMKLACEEYRDVVFIHDSTEHQISYKEALKTLAADAYAYFESLIEHQEHCAEALRFAETRIENDREWYRHILGIEVPEVPSLLALSVPV
ncbi:MAG: hypothetical protein WCV58_04265 [Patescibacteria group bacterium]|jgi:hypothetical protein